ncbi:hypothetical protein GZH46_02347, partial [Fragariocoptes setiger]
LKKDDIRHACRHCCCRRERRRRQQLVEVKVKVKVVVVVASRVRPVGEQAGEICAGGNARVQGGDHNDIKEQEIIIKVIHYGASIVLALNERCLRLVNYMAGDNTLASTSSTSRDNVEGAEQTSSMLLPSQQPSESSDNSGSSDNLLAANEHVQQHELESGGDTHRAEPLTIHPALLPINELRVSGSKAEPPSRPTVDWSRHTKPYFGPNIVRNVSIELGKTAYLSCKVHDLGDKITNADETLGTCRRAKSLPTTDDNNNDVDDDDDDDETDDDNMATTLTRLQAGHCNTQRYKHLSRASCIVVSWIRPNRNEILTAGKYTYTRDSRFSSINDGGPDWMLEIKDVTMADAQNYECQISTDPKLSVNVTLHVKAARARILEGDSYYGRIGSTIELNCKVLVPASTQTSQISVYWYHNGNLLNYASADHNKARHSFTWDPNTATSRFRLLDARATDSGNYSCQPSTAADRVSIKLLVSAKNEHPNGNTNRIATPTRRGGGHLSNGEEISGRGGASLEATDTSLLDEQDTGNSSAYQINAALSFWSIPINSQLVMSMLMLIFVHTMHVAFFTGSLLAFTHLQACT